LSSASGILVGTSLFSSPHACGHTPFPRSTLLCFLVFKNGNYLFQSVVPLPPSFRTVPASANVACLAVRATCPPSPTFSGQKVFFFPAGPPGHRPGCDSLSRSRATVRQPSRIYPFLPLTLYFSDFFTPPIGCSLHPPFVNRRLSSVFSSSARSRYPPIGWVIFRRAFFLTIAIPQLFTNRKAFLGLPRTPSDKVLTSDSPLPSSSSQDRLLQAFCVMDLHPPQAESVKCPRVVS